MLDYNKLSLRIQWVATAIFALYIMASVLDVATTRHVIELNITKLQVASIDGIVRDVDKASPVKLYTGETLYVAAEAKRYHNGINSIERILKNKEKNVETVLEYVRRVHVKGKTSILIKYEMPQTMEQYGCGYQVYSRNSVSYKYDLYTQIFPIIDNVPVLDVCLERNPASVRK